MPDERIVKKVYEWTPKNRSEDDVKNMRINSWKDYIRNRPKWKQFVEKAKISLKL
jgi:hypothetical protein